MPWTYRVVKDMYGFYEIREVYSDPGKPNHSYTADGCAPHGDTLEELQQDLEHFREALNHPVLVEQVVDGEETLVEE